MLIASAGFRRFFYMTSLCGGLVLSYPVFAASVNLPGSADPGRVLEDQKPKLLPDSSLEDAAPVKAAVPVVPDGMDQLRFVLKTISFEGMTAYSPESLRNIYGQFIGQEISVAKLFEIMALVQQKYLDDGFALTKVVIPNQNIQGGEVTFGVIEGHVSTVEISPDIRPSPVIDAAVQEIASMRPLNVKRLERVMLILNDLPDSNVSAVLANTADPAKAEPGSVRLVMQKNPSTPQIASLAFDNHGSKFTGPREMKASANFYHLGPNYSRLSASLMSAVPIQEQKSGSLAYTVPLFGASGTKVTLSTSLAHTEPGSSLSTLDIKGVSKSYDASISYPVIRQRDMTLNIDTGFEMKNARTKIIGEELYDDRLRTMRAGASFNFTDSWAGYTILDVHYTQGLNIFGVRESGSIDLSRQDGQSDFRKFEFLAGRIQALPHNFELFGLLNGQYSYDPLLSSEEFGFGGAQVGRGYDSSEITGDHGFSASFEVRYNTSVPIFKKPLGLQPYLFYDFGKVWNIDPTAKDNVSAASAGFGIRATMEGGWNADLNLAHPLTRSADNEPEYQNDVGGRILFSLSKSF